MVERNEVHLLGYYGTILRYLYNYLTDIATFRLRVYIKKTDVKLLKCIILLNIKSVVPNLFGLSVSSWSLLHFF